MINCGQKYDIFSETRLHISSKPLILFATVAYFHLRCKPLLLVHNTLIE